MAELVLVHGIGPVGEPADFAGEWLEALTAGAPRSVAESVPKRTRVVDYRDWSWATTHGAQGVSNFDEDSIAPEEAELLEQLAITWLEAAAQSTDRDMAVEAGKALAALSATPRDGAQGPMAGARSAVAALARVPVFGPGTYTVVQKVNRTNLWQVTAFVNNIEGTKEAVLSRFEETVTPETRIVLAHSLGTVVAYEAIHHLGLELDLLVTTGSPLGLDRIIYSELQPSAAFPPGVHRWVNVADPDDFIAADPSLADRFPDPTGERVVEDVKVKNSGPFFRHHHITEYLRHDDVRAIIWDALDG